MTTLSTHESESRVASWRPVIVDTAIVLGWFVVAGALAGVVWWQLVDLPEATRQGSSVVVAADQLGKQVGIDGWYAVLALAGGLVSSIVLLAWRRRDPLLMVALVTVGGGAATEVAQRLGRVLGPSSEVAALRGKPDGAVALQQLEVHAPGVLWLWPTAAALGALLYLWIYADPDAS